MDLPTDSSSSQGDTKLESLLDRINGLTKDSPETSPFSPAPTPIEPQQDFDDLESNRESPAEPESPLGLTEDETRAADVDNESNPILPTTEVVPAGCAPPPDLSRDKREFLPKEPASFEAAKITEAEVESLILKYLLNRGDASGRDIADQTKLPFLLVDELIRSLKNDQLLGYQSSAAMGDYVCRLTDIGRERARRLAEYCTYFGAAPVALSDYIDSVKAQSLDTQHPNKAELEHAFSDLLIDRGMLDRLGPAINSGKGMFLFGYPGNGKTSIAERVTAAFGETIWIPRAVGVDGEVIRIFDPMNHQEAPLEQKAGLLSEDKFDKRWIRIKRPTIVVGGELKMSHLEIQFNETNGISEAPVQMKSNCGTLVIDDFGRQSMSTDELLNRWIVPLEKRYDYLNTISGKKIQVPFDQLVVFSTNLEPRDLVDDAFLRRIPYKIEVCNPSEENFRKLFAIMCPHMGFTLNEEAVDHLIEKHYRPVDRPFRNCQPRDLLLQVKNHCLYKQSPLELTCEAFDFAAENYFAVM